MVVRIFGTGINTAVDLDDLPRVGNYIDYGGIKYIVTAIELYICVQSGVKDFAGPIKVHVQRVNKVGDKAKN